MAAAVDEPPGFERPKKRKRTSSQPKLTVNDKVEVRSVEEGFLGSWHIVTVISRKNLVRRVQYDHLLIEDGSGNLIENVNVNPTIDGCQTLNKSPPSYRGLIRPLPPPIDTGKWYLHYGQCVDVLHQDSWWEGVIFDHEDGSGDRKIFFPDIGDELTAGIETLRITQDWDEATGEWTPRGNWIFLELIEEVEREWPIFVSVKQIWYELRIQPRFQELKEWTNFEKDLWKELVLEVMSDNFKLTIKEFFRKSDLELSESVLDEILNPQACFRDFGKSLAVVPCENSCLLDNNQELFQQEMNKILPNGPEIISGDSLNDNNEGFPSRSSKIRTLKVKFKPLTPPKTVKSNPTDQFLVLEGEFCPDAITEYSNMPSASDRASDTVKLSARKHLRQLGWDFKYVKCGKSKRIMYTSTDGKTYNSLRQACRSLAEPRSPIRVLIPQCEETNIDLHDTVIEGEYDPQAVLDYYSIGLEDKKAYVRKGVKGGELLMRAKRHLSAVGWSFYCNWHGGKRELRYCSPCGKLFSSLRSACKFYIDKGVDANIVSFNSERLGKEKGRKTREKAEILQEKDENVSLLSLPKRGRKRKSLTKARDDGDSKFSGRVLRSSKRSREVAVPCSFHQIPRTVLCWLIDNNIVLPRAKVQYQCGKKGRQMAEGRICREGIRCSCCQEVFTLAKFEAHAGGTSCRRASANIFLEDGRSLLECQRQLKREKMGKKAETGKRVMKSNRIQIMNDYICSVCHYGGELVLCDQCPSAFHTSCLGLKNVPDGDWFCPSCCCGICDQSGFSENSDQFVDTSVLICDQCELKYHAGCIRAKGIGKLNGYPKGNWFCGKRCQQIFLGLQRLLGRQIPVGVNNLTWTLLKYVKSDSSSDEAFDDSSIETYSKLSVALDVMHECFEPVKERRTRRDLVEDVIFSRWSELNRLNFRGFYTVLLERSDELITVATLRVYGEKVAEVPLVGTRFQFRRLGMCRVLMNELETTLKEIGVKRLVLPAVHNVLHTWTTSFGFSKMTKSQRLNLLDHTFLDFQGTTMCQKLLTDNPSSELVESRAISCVDLDVNSAVSEVFQAEQAEGSDIVNQGSMDSAGGEGSNTGVCQTAIVIRVNDPEPIQWEGEMNIECSADHKETVNDDSVLKCYKRRRITACRS